MTIEQEFSKKAGEEFLCKYTSPDGLVTKELEVDDAGALLFGSSPVEGGGGNHIVEWMMNGSLGVGTGQDNLRAMPKPGNILSVVITAVQRGKNGTNIFDINKHVPTKPITTQRNATVGTTIYSTQANRPDFDGDDAGENDNTIKEAVLPDITAFLAGDFYSLDVDAAVGGAGAPSFVTAHMIVKFD